MFPTAVQPKGDFTMKLTCKVAIIAAALIGAPLARAHDFDCVKTVNGQQSLTVSTFPTTLNYEWVITNPLTVPSIITSIDDSMFDVSLTPPITVAAMDSVSATQSIVLDTFEECVELAKAEPTDSTIQFTNTLTVGFEGGSTSCWAKVVCKPPEKGEGCLTRTPGFWGNHPDVTAEFLPVESCGLDLTTTLAGDEGSATEDLCSVGKDHKLYASPQQAQLVRQCAAAALNIAASDALGGSCEDTKGFDRFAECCSAEACAAVPEGCIDDLDEFNNSTDTLVDDGGDVDLCQALELGPPCDADPEQCQTANGNAFINDRSAAMTALSSGARLSEPVSGGCASGSAGVLALLATATLLVARRPKR